MFDPIDDTWDESWDVAPPWFPRALDGFVDGPDVELIELIAVVVRQLPDRQSAVLRRRLGLAGHSASTLQTIGEEFGVSRERIRQIQVKAISNLHRGAKRVAMPGSPERELHLRLGARLRAGDRGDRAAFLRATIPEVAQDLIVRVLTPYAPAPPGVLADLLEQGRALLHERRREEAQARRHHALAEIADERLDRLLAAALWPVKPEVASRLELSPVRSVGPDGGSMRSEKADRIVEYESPRELRVLRTLEYSSRVAAYCEQPVKIRYRWFDGPHVYVPDVALLLDDGRLLLVEVKPRWRWVEGRNLAKWNAASRWCRERGWGFAVVDGDDCPQRLLDSASTAAFEVLEEMTAGGEVRWIDVRKRWPSSDRSWDVMVGTALKFGFAVDVGPFSVSRARSSPWLEGLRAGSL